jgi:N-acetylglucosaminyldiphosphoundecaprenol N-acetyl-beta-D-mannosaminyltransferase
VVLLDGPTESDTVMYESYWIDVNRRGPRAGWRGVARNEVRNSGARLRSRTRVRIGHVWIDALGFAEALTEIEQLVAAGRGGAVFTPNVDHVVTAEDDEAFRAAYAAASLSLADGQPLIWASRLLGTPLPAKISGSDLVLPLMDFAGRRGWRVYLLGGRPGAAAAAAERFQRELGVEIAGVDTPSIDLARESQDDAITERIRGARAHLVLVALGAPKQELWIHRVRERIRPAVAIGVGATLDFIAGHVRRAPAWMSRHGLEWLFRLSQEPRRLARRYLLKDPRFVVVLARTLLRTYCWVALRLARTSATAACFGVSCSMLSVSPQEPNFPHGLARL